MPLQYGHGMRQIDFGFHFNTAFVWPIESHFTDIRKTLELILLQISNPKKYNKTDGSYAH